MRLPSRIVPAWIAQAISRRREREWAGLVDAAWKRYWEADQQRREQKKAEAQTLQAQPGRQDPDDEH